MPIEPQWWDSFASPVDATELQGDYGITAGHSLVAQGGRRAVRQGATLGARRLRRAVAALGSGAHWVMGARVQGTSGRPIMRWSEGDTDRMVVNLATSGVTVTIGGSTVATSDPVYLTDEWQYLEIECYVDASSGWVRVYHNRDVIIEWDGDTSTVASVTSMQWTCLSTGAGGAAYWTDLAVAEVLGVDVGDPGNTLGPITAPEVPPDSDVSTGWARSSGADSHALVATSPHDGDANYVESDTADEEDVLGVDASGLSGLPILAVGVVTTARQPNEGSLQLRHGITSGAETQYSDPFNVQESYRTRMEGRWLSDPDDDEPWTPAKVEALNLRYQSRAG